MAQRLHLPAEDRLLLAQVIYEYGVMDWLQVSTRFVEWSTLRGRPTVLNPRDCEAFWTVHMQQMKAVVTDPTFLERTRIPRSPINLELVKGLFRVHLTELHQQILERENAYQTISKEIEDILSGGWDDKIIPKLPQPEVVVPLTASSSSSQLTPIDDSPTPANAAATTGDKTKEEESSPLNVDEGMDVDERDITIREEDSMDVDDVIADIEEEPSAPPAKDKAKEAKVEDAVPEVPQDDEDEDAEGEGEDAEGEDAPDEEKKEEPPSRSLRNRKPLEPLEIPTNIASASKSPRKTRGRGVSDAQPPQLSPTVRRRRNAPETMTKGPQSPTAASVADTVETAATPVAATDENASVVDKDEANRRRTNRAHKRKASEMDVDLPPPTLRVRARSSTIDEEPMTPAIAVSGGNRAINPKTRQAMFQMVQLLTGSKNAEIFQRPVTKKDAPDYAQAVLRPTDLSTIQKGIKSGAIVTWEELERDLIRMLANSCVYNKPGTDAYESARLMLKEVEDNLEATRESTA